MKRFVLAGIFAAALSISGVNFVVAQTTTYVGEIRPYGFGGKCPAGWQQANGAVLQIAKNPALFSLYGTAFGGDGIETFGLPNFGNVQVAWCVALGGLTQARPDR